MKPLTEEYLRSGTKRSSAWFKTKRDLLRKIGQKWRVAINTWDYIRQENRLFSLPQIMAKTRKINQVRKEKTPLTID